MKSNISTPISGFRQGADEALRSFGMLHSADWLVTDVSGQLIGPVRTDMLSHNAGN